MEKQIGKIERKSRTQTGSFLFGTLIGLLLGIGAIVGVCAFAYFKVSANWINDTFNTNVSLGNEDMNNLTLNKLVNHSISLAQNIDSYTLNDLKEDFGVDIGDKIIGISITDLKDVPLPELMDAVQDKLSNISAYELEELFVFEGEVADILDKQNTYYFDTTSKKLYKEAGFTNEVTFAYTHDEAEGNIVVKEQSFNIGSTGEVKIELQYLPLTIALNDFISNLGDNVTIGELADYGVDLPEFLNKPEYSSRKVSDLSDIIDNLTIGELTDLGVTLPDFLSNYTSEKISKLGTVIDNLTVEELFGSSAKTGALGLIAGTTKISDVPSALSEALETKTIADFITAGVLVESEIPNYTTYKDYDTILLKEDGVTKKKVHELTLPDLVDVVFNNITLLLAST